jgi:hypothetical protein
LEEGRGYNMGGGRLQYGGNEMFTHFMQIIGLVCTGRTLPGTSRTNNNKICITFRPYQVIIKSIQSEKNYIGVAVKTKPIGIVTKIADL